MVADTANQAALDAHFMRRAIAAAADSRLVAPPNPWVGSVVVAADGESFVGSTEAPGSRHAEIVALDAAGPQANGATVYTTLEPCSHQGRTGPCTTALIDAGVARVVVGLGDPDPQVSGSGIAKLEAAGIEVTVNVEADAVQRQLAPYLTHRRTGRPLVVLKLAATIDGYLAASDGSSQWITGEAARNDVHRLRAESDAICVGAGTVRSDDPSLTVRSYTPAVAVGRPLDPFRVVLGSAGSDAKAQPIEEFTGELEDLLDSLGDRSMLQLLVEGGGAVAGAFHRAGLVDQYVIYMAPAFLGGSDGVAMFGGQGVATMSELRRGAFESVTQLGDDIRLVVSLDR